MQGQKLSVLVVGLGQMGRSHALAYHNHPGFNLVGLVNRSAPTLPEELRAYPLRHDFAAALTEFSPQVVSISTHTDTHADMAIAAIESGAHVFVEKPLAANVRDAERVVAAAKANDRKLVVGYILRHHPSWIRLIEEAKATALRVADVIGRPAPGFATVVLPVGSSLHYQGTIRMGAEDDGTSVCDRQSRVWGFENLYVAGNGVIPTVTATNPTLFSVALATFGARQVAQERRRA